jgi:ribose transport system permease protein
MDGVLRARWSVAALGCIILLVALMWMSGQNGLGIFVANTHLAAFVAICAIGQMLVITTGDGAIDLSIPYGISLSVYVTTILQQSENSRLPWAIAVSLLIGLAVGLFNGFLVTVLRIPAMVGTLAVGFVLDSIVNLLSNVPGRGQASPALQAIAKGDVLGVPIVVVIAVIIAVAAAVFIWRSVPGLRIMATGQNDRAAQVAGLNPGTARMLAFAISGVLAALTGVLLCGFSNGAFLGIGSTYLVASLAAVVIGGTLIAGGKPTVIGCLCGALFMTLIVTLNNTLAVPVGVRWIVQGAVIIAALALPRRGPRP